MLKLFAVLLGGRARGAHLELHDIVFTIGETLETRYPYLIHQWFGDVSRLHIDSSAELLIIDGHEVRIVEEKSHFSEQSPSLYFVNFGGYKPGIFGEFHEMSFYVGPDKKEVIARARQELCAGYHQQHCDDNYEIGVDDIIKIDQVGQHYIELVSTTLADQVNIESQYRRLDVPEIVAASQQLL